MNPVVHNRSPCLVWRSRPSQEEGRLHRLRSPHAFQWYLYRAYHDHTYVAGQAEIIVGVARYRDLGREFVWLLG